jgi:hypothetical protein
VELTQNALALNLTGLTDPFVIAFEMTAAQQRQFNVSAQSWPECTYWDIPLQEWQT